MSPLCSSSRELCVCVLLVCLGMVWPITTQTAFYAVYFEPFMYGVCAYTGGYVHSVMCSHPLLLFLSISSFLHPLLSPSSSSTPTGWLRARVCSHGAWHRVCQENGFICREADTCGTKLCQRVKVCIRVCVCVCVIVSQFYCSGNLQSSTRRGRRRLQSKCLY